MKEILKYLSIAVCYIVLFSCEKDFDPDGRFVGSWKILTPDIDTLSFTDESSISRRYYDGLDPFFEYSYDRDSITIQYSGPNKILVRPSTHYYEFNNEGLLIDFTNGCYGFDSKIYNLSKIE